MDIPLQSLLKGMMFLGLRVSGLMLFAPFFSNATIPPRIKVILTIAITAILYPTMSNRLLSTQWEPLVVASEMVIGIAMGITTNLVFEAAQFAGQILSVQMGYSLVNIMDPTTQVETTVMSMFHNLVVMLIFLHFDVHHWILRAVAHSFDYLPVGAPMATGGLTMALLHSFTVVLQLGIQIAAPVLAATIAADVALGMLGKASPQLPLMMMGPSIKSLLGLGVLSAAICYWPPMFEKFFGESIAYTDRILQLAH